MSSTYLSLYYHLIFSTVDRAPSIKPEWRQQLHQYLGGTANKLGAQSLGIGGIDDHVHALVQLQATHCLADFMRGWKKASSAWVRSKPDSPNFGWQKGYAALTVSASVIPQDAQLYR